MILEICKGEEIFELLSSVQASLGGSLIVPWGGGWETLDMGYLPIITLKACSGDAWC
jgi:hypothetical protein